MRRFAKDEGWAQAPGLYGIAVDRKLWELSLALISADKSSSLMNARAKAAAMLAEIAGAPILEGEDSPKPDPKDLLLKTVSRQKLLRNNDIYSRAEFQWVRVHIRVYDDNERFLVSVLAEEPVEIKWSVLRN